MRSSLTRAQRNPADGTCVCVCVYMHRSFAPRVNGQEAAPVAYECENWIKAKLSAGPCRGGCMARD